MWWLFTFIFNAHGWQWTTFQLVVALQPSSFMYPLRWIQKNGNVINSCYYREMPNVLKKNLIIIKSIIVSKWNHFFTKNYFRKKKINFCYGFMPSDFQVICGSMVCKNCWLLASTETPVCDMCTSIHINF